MAPLQLSLPSGKADFNLDEAAGVLGISSNELKSLVEQRLGGDRAAMNNISKLRFRPADLIMLNMMQATHAVGDLD
jgi:hypothetical protein